MLTRPRRILVLLAVPLALTSVAGTAAPVGAVPVGTTAPGARAEQLNGLDVRLDAAGRLLPWDGPRDTAYAEVSRLAWDYLLTDVPEGAGTGAPAYLSYSYLDP